MPKKTPVKGRKHKLLEPPLPHQLHSSAPITDQEHDVVVQAVARVQRELDSLILEVQGDQGESEFAYRRRLAFEDFIRQHMSLLHWHRRIPMDILVDIFTWCTEGGTVVPFSVSQVCKRWRVIALATSELWRKIPFHRSFINPAAGNRFVRFLSDDYLDRSKDQPLNFIWHPYYGEVAEKIWRALAKHVSRWEDIQMVVDQQYDAYLFERIEALDGQLCSLYSLKLTIMKSSDDPDLRPFASASHLQYLAWKDTRQRISMGDEIMLTGWPWPSLTHMSVSCKRLDCVDPAIFFSTTLVYLHLKFSSWKDVLLNKFVPPGEIRLESCVFLDVEVDEPEYLSHGPEFSSFFSSIYCPSLTTLSVKYAVITSYLGWSDEHQEQINHVLELFSSLVKRHSHLVKDLRWNSRIQHCKTTYSHPNYPPIINHINTERRIFDILPNLTALTISFPSHKTLGGILLSLQSHRDFMPGLRNFAVLINPQKGAMEANEISSFCNLFNQFVRKNETCPTSSPSRRPIDNIRVNLVVPPTVQPDVIISWDIVAELESWKNTLLNPDSFQRFMCTNIHSLDTPSEDPPLEDHDRNNTQLVSCIPLSIRSFLIQYLHKCIPPDKWYSRKFCRPFNDIIKYYIELLLKEAPSRKWTAASSNSLVYIPSDSPLRRDNALWALGIIRGDIHKDPDGSDKNAWLKSEDLAPLHPLY